LVIEFLNKAYNPIFKKITDILVNASTLSNFFPYMIEDAFIAVKKGIYFSYYKLLNRISLSIRRGIIRCIEFRKF